MHNILICDDERDIVSALKICLSGEDYRLFEAYDGQAALETVRQAILARGLRPGEDITLDIAWRDRVGSGYTLQRER